MHETVQFNFSHVKFSICFLYVDISSLQMGNISINVSFIDLKLLTYPSPHRPSHLLRWNTTVLSHIADRELGDLVGTRSGRGRIRTGDAKLKFASSNGEKWFGSLKA